MNLIKFVIGILSKVCQIILIFLKFDCFFHTLSLCKGVKFLPTLSILNRFFVKFGAEALHVLSMIKRHKNRYSQSHNLPKGFKIIVQYFLPFLPIWTNFGAEIISYLRNLLSDQQ